MKNSGERVLERVKSYVYQLCLREEYGIVTFEHIVEHFTDVLMPETAKWCMLNRETVECIIDSHINFFGGESDSL